MNIMQLKYAIEVERTRSISKAAEALFMAQPNLSRSVKELEEELGITLFKRTSKGIVPTLSGEEFLNRAKDIVKQMDELEEQYKNKASGKLSFNISVPRASIISHAFTEFVKLNLDAERVEFNFKETNSLRAITNILEKNFNLGIIRYQKTHEPYFETLLKEKGLAKSELWEFKYYVLMSDKHPLAEKDEISLSDLKQYIEVALGDPYVPYISQSEASNEELESGIERRIFVYERGSQFDLLGNIPQTYMWESNMPPCICERYGLVLKPCAGNERFYKDVLIHKKSYKLTALDDSFIKVLKDSLF